MVRSNTYTNLHQMLSVERTKPDVIAVTLGGVFYQYEARPELRFLYDLFPLRDMVTTMLSVPPDNDDGELIWLELDRRLEGVDLNIDMYSLQHAFNHLGSLIDEEIHRQVPPWVDLGAFSFYEWLGYFDVALICDKELDAIYRPVQPGVLEISR